MNNSTAYRRSTTNSFVISGILLGVALACGRGESAPPPKAEPPLPVQDVDRGVELYEKKQYEQAAGVLSQAVETTRADARAWTYLGLARIEMKQFAQAQDALQRALELDDDSAKAYYGLGLIHGHQNNVEESIRDLKKSVEIDPSHAYAHYHLGLAYNAAGQPDLTILHLDRFLDLAPDAPEAGQVRDLLSRLR